MTVEELADAAKAVIGETSGNPARIAHMMRYWLARRCGPGDDPIDAVRGMISDILCELEVQWDRAEDAPTWPDYSEDE